MIYYTMISKQCIKEAQKYNVQEEIEKIAKKIEKDQSVANWETYLPDPFIKKNIGRDFRLLAATNNFDENIVIVLLSVVSRGNAQYESDPRNYVVSRCKSIKPSKNELTNFLNKRKKDEIEVDLIPTPSSSEYEVLFNSHAKISDDLKSEGIIYESLDWIELINNENISKDISRFYDILYDNFSKTDLNSHQFEFVHSREKNIRIIYKYFPKSNSLFLIAPINKTNSHTLDYFEKKYLRILNSDDIQIHDLLKKSGRSYPALILVEEDLWREIQINEEGNIALSPEEAEILDIILHKNDEYKYPLFINGRPGSGKSTLLQYIFANQLYSHMSKNSKDNQISPPIYLTYSEKLVETAKKNVQIILRCNANIALNGDISVFENNIDFYLNNSFMKFDEFLLKYLDENHRKKFNVTGHIDFRKFKNLWKDKNISNPDAELRKFSPELVWHVIRTYIKGMSDDNNEYLDGLGYKELPAKQKTVSELTFEKIYTSIWRSWYYPLCIDNNYWDDQDLSRFILNNLDHGALAKYPAIFCDEAQDFTRIELELIFKLSLFSRRKLSGEELKHIPIAFAGDPFQTLNPTGFDWDIVQSSFHEKIIQQLDQLGKAKLKFNYQELTYNYRSLKNIIGLGNLIQILRGNLFNIKGLKPQMNWFDYEGEDPIWFDVEDEEFRRKIAEETEQIIILPCQEGEEEEFVKNDDFLIKISGRDIRNNLSPMSAKGLEFNRVVLYCFGRDYLQNYPNLLDPLSIDVEYDSREQSLPYEYFMNRLYVAVSRAKKRLIIVDTEEGLEKFWLSEIFKNTEMLVDRYSSLTNNIWDSKEHLSLLQPGNSESWDKDRDNPLNLARDFYNTGIMQHDSYYLKLASRNFSRANYKNEALRCDALRYEYEGEHVKAGEIYYSLKEFEKALSCLWNADSYSKILQYDRFSNTIEYRTSVYMSHKNDASSAFNFLKYLSNKAKGSNNEKLITDEKWQKVISDILDSVVQSNKDDVKTFKQISAYLESLLEEGISLPITRSHGLVLYLAEKYEDAIKIWDKMEHPPKSDSFYNEALAETLSYPENIEPLYKNQNFKKIVSDYRRFSKTSISEDQRKMVAKALLEENDFDFLYKIVSEYKLVSLIDEIIIKLTSIRYKSKLYMKFCQLRVQFYADSQNYIDATQFIYKLSLPDSLSLQLHSHLIYRISKDENFSEKTIDEQNRVADYLKKQLIKGNNNWQKFINIKIAGAAIERSNRIIDALQFYELVWAKKQLSSVTSFDEHYSKLRWLKVKKRYIDYLKGEKQKDSVIFKHTKEFDKKRKDFNVEPDDLDNLPIFPDINKEEVNIDTLHHRSILFQLNDAEQAAISGLLNSNMPPEQIAEALKIEISLVDDYIAYLKSKKQKTRRKK